MLLEMEEWSSEKSSCVQKLSSEHFIFLSFSFNVEAKQECPSYVSHVPLFLLSKLHHSAPSQIYCSVLI